jgi:hypothetical protein
MGGGGGVGAEGTIAVAGCWTTICVVGGGELWQAASISIAGNITRSV